MAAFISHEYFHAMNDYLAITSRHITDLQNSPGRLVQTIEQARLAST